MRAMLQIASIFAWMGLGFALRRARPAGGEFIAINRAIIWFCLPATVLLAIHGLTWEASDWIPVSMSWIVFLAGAGLLTLLGRMLGWSASTTGALLMTAALGNTSFVGFPLLRALEGERAIAVGILCDQPGSFMVLSTLGIFSASYFSSGRPSLRAMIVRVLGFPPIWALLLALLSRPFSLPSAVSGLLGWGLVTLIPLALISVGGRLRFDRALFRRESAPAVYGLLYKLVLAPLLMTLLLVAILKKDGEMVRVTILEAAMGPMITGAIVADEYGLDPELCSLMVSVGTPLCLLTVPLWAKILALLGV